MTLSTIGVAFSKITHDYGGKTIHLNVWDMAGQETFRSINHLYYRNSDCVLIVFDLTDKNSLKDAKELYDEMELKRRQNEHTPLYILVGTKFDLQNNIEIDYDIVKHTFCSDFNYITVSSKTNHNIHLLFETICSKLLDNCNTIENKNIIQLNPTRIIKRKCCWKM